MEEHDLQGAGGGSGNGPSLPTRTDGGEPSFDGFDVGRVLDSDRGCLLLDHSPLSPSRVGCVGDQGTIDGTRVVDVTEEAGGLLHVLDGDLDVRTGAYVPIWRDGHRRDRIERTHGAVVVCLAELQKLRIPVAWTETVAGMAWIETQQPAPPLTLSLLDGEDEAIEIQAIGRDRMAVLVGDQMVSAVPGPIARSTSRIGKAEVRRVAALDFGHEALEIALPDDEGRAWWL